MDKVAFVTGASSGIGEATARNTPRGRLQGLRGARRLDRMADLAALGATLVALDLTDDASIVAAVDTIKNTSGRLDVLVNNAGYGSYGALEDVPLEEARRQFEVNVFGLARLCQLVLPMMRAQKSGKIVNVTSIGGKMWEPFGAWYHATKFAVEGLSDCLRVEVERFGIDVIIIEPGAIQTEWAGIAAEPLARLRRRRLRRIRAAHARCSNGRNLEAALAARRRRPHDRARRARPAPKTRYATGGGASMILFLEEFCPTVCSTG